MEHCANYILIQVKHQNSRKIIVILVKYVDFCKFWLRSYCRFASFWFCPRNAQLNAFLKNNFCTFRIFINFIFQLTNCKRSLLVGKVDFGLQWSRFNPFKLLTFHLPQMSKIYLLSEVFRNIWQSILCSFDKGMLVWW